MPWNRYFDLYIKFPWLIFLNSSLFLLALSQEWVVHRSRILINIFVGSPSNAVQRFLRRLGETLPVGWVGDNDVKGHKIFIMLRCGGTKTLVYGHERKATPGIHLLGLVTDDREKYTMTGQETPLTQTDKRLLELILQRPNIQANPFLKSLFVKLKQKNSKRSIQSLYQSYQRIINNLANMLNMM